MAEVIIKDIPPEELPRPVPLTLEEVRRGRGGGVAEERPELKPEPLLPPVKEKMQVIEETGRGFVPLLVGEHLQEFREAEARQSEFDVRFALGRAKGPARGVITPAPTVTIRDIPPQELLPPTPAVGTGLVAPKFKEFPFFPKPVKIVEQQTREELIRETTTERLRTGFEGMTPEQLRAGAMLPGTGIVGESTLEGEIFTFVPTPSQVKVARGEAKEEVGMRGIKAEIATGIVRGGIGLVEFISDIPFQAGMRQFRTKEELKEPAGFGRLISEREFVKEIREVPLGFPGMAAEIGTGVVAPAVVGGVAGFRGFRGLRAAGLTRGEAAGELVAGISPIQIKQRVFTPEVTEIEDFVGAMKEVKVGKGPTFQVFEGISPTTDVKITQVGLAGEIMGKPAGVGVGFVRRPKVEIRTDIFEGVRIKETKVGEIIPTVSLPETEMFRATALIRGGRRAALGMEVPETRVQVGFGRPLWRIEEQFFPKRVVDIRSLMGEPPVTTRAFVGERRLTKLEREAGKFAVRREEFGFAIGEELFIGPRIKGEFPREPVTPFIPKIRGRGERFLFRKIEEPGTTFLRAGQVLKKPRLKMDVKTQEVFPQQLGATLKAVPKMKPPVTAREYPTIVGGAGARGAFTGMGLYERVEAGFVFERGVQLPPGPGLIFKPRVDVKLFDFTRQRFDVGLRERLGERGREAFLFGVTPAITPATSLRFREKFKMPPVEILGLGFRFGVPTRRITTPGITTPGRPRPFLFPFGFLPPIGFPEPKLKKRKPRRKLKRQPSVLAGEFDIRALKPVKFEETGLVVRPILR